jgi:3-oxoadipate enol-lactonase
MRAQAADGSGIGFDVVGEGEPLVLLAGQANSRVWWDSVRPELAAGHRTIAVDAAGTGDSDDAADGHYSTSRFARDVVAVLDHLGVERAHVYGTSMGGKTAQRLAIEHPGRVGALVLGCTTPGRGHGLTTPPDVVQLLVGPERRKTLIELMYTPSFTGDPAKVLGDGSMSAVASRGHKRASSRHEAWDDLPGITAPTLVVHGVDDLLAPVGNARLIADRIPGAALYLLENARHAYFDEFAYQATPAVLDFLHSHPVGSR